MNLAKELRIPFVSFIDTAGAELSAAAEERAITGEIARCIGTMVTMTVPTVSVLKGEGTGGGALAMLPAQRVIATEHSWLSPLAPEEALTIVYGDAAHAAEMASSQHIGAADLLRNGARDRSRAAGRQRDRGDLCTRDRGRSRRTTPLPG